MTDRERLLEILNVPIYPHENVDPLEAVADYLLDNGVTFTPAIPGPSDADPNIMELCFHNGERHMKEKVINLLLDNSQNKEGVCKALVLDLAKKVETL
jgi:hypothetical protein